MSALGLVCWEIEPLERSRRHLDERLALAAPWLGRALWGRAERQPAGSMLRRSLLTRAVRVGFAANNRRDYEAMGAFFHPEIEMIPPGGGELAVDFDPIYRGADGVRRFDDQWKSGFGGLRHAVREIADAGGGHFAVRVEMIGTIGDSATEVRDEYAVVNTMENGQLIRQENFFQWQDALEALASGSR